MSCGNEKQSFRLLDAFVGWDTGTDKSHFRNLTGLRRPSGVRLKQINSAAVDAGQILDHIPPVRLARGCSPCEWYLLTPSRVLHRSLSLNQWRLSEAGCEMKQSCCGQDCTVQWFPLWDLCAPDLENGIAIAAWRHRIAVVDSAKKTIRLWARSKAKLLAEVAVNFAGPIAFNRQGHLLVVAKDSSGILIYDPIGHLLGELPAKIPITVPKTKVDRIAVSGDHAVWLVLIAEDRSLQLWRAARGASSFERASVDQLSKVFSKTGITAASDAGFCIEEKRSDGLPVTCCYTWYGRCAEESDIEKPEPLKRHKRGQLLTQAIDSGIPRCEWHRVRIDAVVPPGTNLSVAVSTAESSEGDVVNPPNDEWNGFPAGITQQSDWQISPAGSLDFLINQPAGRYLFFRMRFTGDGVATPVVRRVRFDFPRVTSADFLPAVYHENPVAIDFTERFLSLFDSTVTDIDRAIERFPALLDPESVPGEVLPWLGSFLDLTFDRAWDVNKRKKILKALPKLYRLRGTVAGLKLAIQLVFDVKDVFIDEMAGQRNWGGIEHDARVGLVRLFGKSRARFRLNSSPLSHTPIRRYGNPDQDPLTSHAYRFRVFVSPNGFSGKIERDRFEKLVASQKPAHTVASTRIGGTGFVLGYWSAVGIDTAFTALAPPVLGKEGNVRLSRMSILWQSREGPNDGIVIGRNAYTGLQTIAI